MAETGGYADVARALNKAYAWPGKEGPVDRRQVEAWHKRRTLNKAGQLPPSPAAEKPDAPRTTPRFLFDTADWVEWARPGVPALGAAGHWVVPEPGPDPRPARPPHPRRHYDRPARPRVMSDFGRLIFKGGDRDQRRQARERSES